MTGYDLCVVETDCGDIHIVNHASDNADVVAVLENTGDEQWMAFNVLPLANLFAAAPVLLAACKYVAQFNGPLNADQMRTLANRCEAAIASAR